MMLRKNKSVDLAEMTEADKQVGAAKFEINLHQSYELEGNLHS